MGQSHLISQLAATVEESVRLHLHDNAVFLAECLFSATDSDAHAALLADCYLRQGKPRRAYQVLSNGRAKDANARYLLAVAAVQLELYEEAEVALTQGRQGAPAATDAPSRYLLGRICLLTSRHDAAREHFRAATRADPLLFSAYAELCQLGAADPWPVPPGAREALHVELLGMGVDPAPAGSGPEALAVARGATGPGATPATPAGPVAPVLLSAQLRGAPRPGPAPGASGVVRDHTGTSGAPARPQTRAWAAGAGRHIQFDEATPMSTSDASSARGPDSPEEFRGFHVGPVGEDHHTPVVGPAAPGAFYTPPVGVSNATAGPPPLPRAARAERYAARVGATPQGDTPVPPGLTPPLPAAAPGRKFTDHGGKLRKLSNRLFAESAAPMQDAGDLAGRAEGDRGEGPPPWPSPQGQAAACALLEPFASGMRLLGLMQCPEAVEALQQLPAALYMSSWVLGCVGRALLEHGDHAGAAEVFREMRRVDPACDEGLVHFSTALWYLGHAAELSALAHEAVQLDRHSAQAWCAAGNCVSLQRDHRKALRYFRKALEVDRHNAYAHTLCGHELLAMEELEAALASYRAALVLQPRHYNAWYGMGQVFMRQEKLEMAEYHFQRAIQVHPRSSVLKCHCAVAMAKASRRLQALSLIQDAIRQDPKNPLARYERAVMLLEAKQARDALEELLVLRELAPKEVPVHVSLGRAYRMLGEHGQALAAYTAALDLSPPDADTAAIKAAMERVTQAQDPGGEAL